MSDSERLEKLIESNAKSIQALNNTVSDAIRQLTAQIAESNRFSTERMDRLTDTVAETNRQMAEHSARTNSAISEIALRILERWRGLSTTTKPMTSATINPALALTTIKVRVWFVVSFFIPYFVSVDRLHISDRQFTKNYPTVGHSGTEQFRWAVKRHYHQ